jgi:hypothetical protein
LTLDISASNVELWTSALLATPAAMWASALRLALTLALTAAAESHGSLRSLSLRVLAAAATPAAMPVSTIVIRLPNREFRDGAGDDWLSFRTWQRGADERPSYGAFFRSGRGDVLARRRNLRCDIQRGCYRRRGLRDFGRWSGRVPDSHGMMSVVGIRQRRDWQRGVGVLLNRFVLRFGFVVCESRRRVRALQPIEDLTEQRRLRPLAALRGHLALFVLVFRVADDAAGLFDTVVDHRHDSVIGNSALARTVIVQHVARPKPALLHALPRQTELRSPCRRDGH